MPLAESGQQASILDPCMIAQTQTSPLTENGSQLSTNSSKSGRSVTAACNQGEYTLTSQPRQTPNTVTIIIEDLEGLDDLMKLPKLPMETFSNDIHLQMYQQLALETNIEHPQKKQRMEENTIVPTAVVQGKHYFIINKLILVLDT